MAIEHLTPQLSRGGRLLLFAAGWTALAIPVAYAQANAAPVTASPQTVDQGLKPITFEAASIRPSTINVYNGHELMADGIDYKGATPLLLIILAYHLYD